jgi:hypothetical protein
MVQRYMIFQMVSTDCMLNRLVTHGDDNECKSQSSDTDNIHCCSDDMDDIHSWSWLLSVTANTLRVKKRYQPELR